MSINGKPQLEPCNCAALRAAARHVSQMYDGHISDAELRTSQFTILSMLKRLGPTTINTLARNMVMDRTTLGRNIVPLQRRRLITARRSPTDGRSKELQLTQAGLARLEASVEGWRKAQTQFEAALGPERLAQLRSLLQVVVESDLRIDGDSRN